MVEHYLRVTSKPPLGLILLDHGVRKNVLSPPLIQEFAHQVRLFEQNPDIKVILIGSTSSGFFSAGVDIHFMAQTAPDIFAKQDALGGNWRVLEQVTKPVIAVVQGYCLGGGLELALMADMMFLSTEAQLGFPEIKLGLMPGLGGTQRLSRLIGTQRAALWILSGRTFLASEAFAMGVGSCLIDDHSVWSEAETVAHTVASYNLEALQEAKRMIHINDETTLPQGVDREKLSFYRLFQTPQAQKGLQTFLKKKDTAPPSSA